MISQGAEAIIRRSVYLDRDCIIKERISKSYRVEQLDKKINKQRFNQEIRCLNKCIGLGIPVPTIYFIDKQQYHIYMEFIEGGTLRESLKTKLNEDKFSEYSGSLGEILARLHNGDIFHGDLTTSNIMVTDTNKIMLIDFGLAISQCSTEDKAVDLYVLERSFLSSHPEYESLFTIILTSYEAASNKGKEIMSKLKQVRARGRKRDMVG